MAWELLYGERPFAGDTLVTLAAAVLAGQRRPARRGRKVPTWLREVLERGLSLAPARRWPTMTELLAALARGRRRARLRGPLAALGGVVAITVTGVLLGRWDLAQREARCAAAGAEIATVWDDAARARVRAAFVTTGVSHAVTTAERVMPWIDREAEAWQAARSEACAQAELRAAWDADTLRRSLWCLEDRRIELESLVAMLGRADAAAVQQAVSAAAALHAPWPCVDVDTLRRQPKPPDDSVVIQEIRGELARVHTLELAGRYEEALTVASQARARAEAESEWPPLAVVARAREAEMLIRTADYSQAEAADGHLLRRGEARRVGAGRAGGDPADQRDRRQVGKTRRGARVGAARRGRGGPRRRPAAVDREHATVGAGGGGVRGGRHPLGAGRVRVGAAPDGGGPGDRAPLVANALNNVAVMHYLSGDLTRARGLQERSPSSRSGCFGPEHPEVATSLGNLAPVLADLGEHDAAQRLYEQALAIRERALGHDHPDVARNLNNLATMLAEKGEHARARELFTRALAIQERVYGRDNLELSATLNNLALSYDRTGELKEARALFERSLAIYIAALGHDHLNVATTMHNLASTELAQGARAGSGVVRAGAGDPREAAGARRSGCGDHADDPGRRAARARAIPRGAGLGEPGDDCVHRQAAGDRDRVCGALRARAGAGGDRR
nr:tetratricopeptide repeat-containing protein kinase family protein [Nannocystis sp.]